jgi:hypothetical protein
MWKVNPNFFGVTAIVCVIILLTISEILIEAKIYSIEISFLRWLPFLSTTEIFSYDQIVISIRKARLI